MRNLSETLWHHRANGNAYYSDTIPQFINTSPNFIQGSLNTNSEGPVETAQRDSWGFQIELLQKILSGFKGKIYFEYSIPRMGRRIDVVLVIDSVIFVLEFKIGATTYNTQAIDQVWDYALDLKNFHETSHYSTVAPVLVCTGTEDVDFRIATTPQNDNLLFPLMVNTCGIRKMIDSVLEFSGTGHIDADVWERGRYCPTPTIIEAALALYRGHNVREISRTDASAKNLHETTDVINGIIDSAKKARNKSICFITGVPGAGKTLIGLNIATKHLQDDETYGVFLSGNGPLVEILQEALARDLVLRKKEHGERISKKEAHSKVKAFVQNVHHYRDACLRDSRPPVDHVALFDEAQRAWDVEKASDFMARKKKILDFKMSEPEFLISCIDRHSDWGVIVCLMGGGQEIHTGEAGIGEWIDSLNRSFPDWHIYISSRLLDSEYGAGSVLETIKYRKNVFYKDDLHLSVSMRSFRTEIISLFVKQLLDLENKQAKDTWGKIMESGKYPIVITRDILKAKKWLKEKARGSERYGIVVSSQAERLKPHAIDIKSPMNPIHWFLAGKEDVRSSYYLEDVATEFSVQGLELDWVCVTWDGDFRYRPEGWEHYSFCGAKWFNINKPERKMYLKNAYRVLLTRARQGMVIVVPEGSNEDPTRSPLFYDSTFNYLKEIGIPVLQ